MNDPALRDRLEEKGLLKLIDWMLDHLVGRNEGVRFCSCQLDTPTNGAIGSLIPHDRMCPSQLWLEAVGTTEQMALNIEHCHQAAIAYNMMWDAAEKNKKLVSGEFTDTVKRIITT